MYILVMRHNKDISTLFGAVCASDYNASKITFPFFAEEYGIEAISKNHIVLDNGEAFQDALDLYLHCVYEDSPLMLDALMLHGVKMDSSLSVNCFDEKTMGRVHPILGELLFDGANDVCWATISPQAGALKTLLDFKNKHGLDLSLNDRDVIPYNQKHLKNAAAKRHTPLDLAVMQYVAVSKMEEKLKIPDLEIEELTDSIKEIFDTENVNVLLADRGQGEATSHQSIMLEKIKLLMNAGALGSTEAYFPLFDDASENPFCGAYDFEIMSINDFCERHRDILPPALMTEIDDRLAVKSANIVTFSA